VKIPHVVLPIFFDKPVKLWPSSEFSSSSSPTFDIEKWYDVEANYEHKWSEHGDDNDWPSPIFQYDQPSSVHVDGYCDATFKSSFTTNKNPCNEAYLQSCQIRCIYFWPCEIKVET